MTKSVEAKLDYDPFNRIRLARFGYTFYGDISFEVAYESVADTDSVKEFMTQKSAHFTFSHGSYVNLVAWFSCFAWRCKRSEESLRASRSVKEIIAPPDYATYSYSLRRLVMVAQDQSPVPRFDDPVKRWKAVDIPMVAQPGVIEDVGGTGIYTGKDGMGNDCLIFHSIPSQTDKTLQEARSHAEFYIDDVAPVIKAIAELATGDYENQIWQLADAVLAVK